MEMKITTQSVIFLLGSFNINIAEFILSRKDSDDLAYSIIKIDEKVSDDILLEISKVDEIIQIKQIIIDIDE